MLCKENILFWLGYKQDPMWKEPYYLVILLLNLLWSVTKILESTLPGVYVCLWCFHSSNTSHIYSTMERTQHFLICHFSCFLCLPRKINSTGIISPFGQMKNWGSEAQKPFWGLTVDNFTIRLRRTHADCNPSSASLLVDDFAKAICTPWVTHSFFLNQLWMTIRSWPDCDKGQM